VALRTVGHGTLAADAFATLLESAGVTRVVDIRSYPGSRHNPQFRREEMERWLSTRGLDYEWLRALGGRRRPVPTSKHHALRNEAFRGYADYMETEAFRWGVDQLVDHTDLDATTVMCSESLWWRCHRRLLADHLVLVRGLEVVHLLHDRRVTPHVPTDGVRRDGDRLVYDVGSTPPLLEDSQ
jgi:uncharacterized protein (DUF488 family)